uniref:Uncharacterized protein n=1 Tax=Panagrolaimus sp. PS1159 TaxID=55785 RepID=A0AC35F1H8_9BILA
MKKSANFVKEIAENQSKGIFLLITDDGEILTDVV